ncbi:MAG: hypothetical protein V7785_10365 [Bermanella sp.]
MENAQEVKQEPANNKSRAVKSWLYKITFGLVIIVAGAQYLSSYLAASDIKKELAKGFDGIEFENVKVEQSFLYVNVSAEVIPMNRFNNTQYTDLLQSLDMRIDVLAANLDKVKQLTNQKPKYNRYTLEGVGKLTGEDFNSSLSVQLMLDGDFILIAKEAESTEFLEGEGVLYSKGDQLVIERSGGEVSLNYELDPTTMYMAVGVFSAESISYQYSDDKLPTLNITGLSVQHSGPTLADVFAGSMGDETVSSAHANILLTGLDIDTLMHIFSVKDELETLEENDFKRTKLEASLQEVAKRLVENSVSLKADLSLSGQGLETQYEIDVRMQSEHQIFNYKDMFTALKGDIDRQGDRPVLPGLKQLDRMFQVLSDKSEALRFRAVALQ